MVLLVAVAVLHIGAAKAEAQARCNTDVDCRQSRGDFDKCINGGCFSSECDIDSDCPARHRCENLSNGKTRCVEVDCRTDSDCPPPGDLTPGDARRYCIDYTCEQCKVDSQCGSRSCNEQTHDCITCRSNSDCPQAFPRCFHGNCGNCASDADCRKPGYCGPGNVCLTGVCRTPADCPPGWDCRNGRCGMAQTDMQRLVDELRNLRRVEVELPKKPGKPATFKLGEIASLINGSKAVRSTIGLVILDKRSQTLLDIGRFAPNNDGSIALPRSFSGTPSSTIPRTGDLCGFGVGITDARGKLLGQTSVCLEVR